MQRGCIFLKGLFIALPVVFEISIRGARLFGIWFVVCGFWFSG